jgi:hypothetical protein
LPKSTAGFEALALERPRGRANADTSARGAGKEADSMRAMWLCLGAAILAAGCSDDDETPDTPDVLTSTVEGKLELATFTPAPTGVDALDEAGARVSSPLAPDGAFRLTLPKEHVYKLVIVGSQGEIPIVFPRVPARLDKTFRVSSGNGVVALGVIRHFVRAPDAGFTVRKASAPGAAPDPVVCANGLLAGTATPCVEDHEQTACAPGVAVDRDDDEDEDDDDRALPPEEDADPAQPFAVPEQNAPNDVTGCDD